MAYDAFISYSHAADGQLAPALQAGMQRLAKPWNRRRALHVFRDETGLSTNPHLWSSIERALDASEWFVLLASPEAAQSEWVNREVAHWVATKPADRILPVVTDGTWFWDAAASALRGDAVPDALQAVLREEPRHLDLRWARTETDLDLRHSRFRAAVADVAATVHGVAKDELEGEDIRQHRRARRLARAAIAGLTVLLVVAVGSAVLAVVQRGRADQQATRARVQATLADARRLAAQAVSGAHDDLALSALLAIEGRRLHDDPDTRGALLTVAQDAMSIRTMIHGSWDAAALAPDGRTVAVAGPQGLFRVDLRTRRFTRLGTARFRDLRSADFSANGRFIALGGEDVRLIDARTGAEALPPLRFARAPSEVTLVTALRFAPDSRSLAALTDGGDGRVWSVPDGQDLGHFGTFTYTVNGIDYSPDGRILAGTGYPGIDLDAASMQPLHPANNNVTLPDEYGVAFSPDGARVAVGQIGSVIFRNPTTGVVSGPTIDTGTSAAQLLSFRGDGRAIAAARTDGTVSLFDSTSGVSLRAPLVGATRGPLALRFLREKDRLVLVTGAEIIVYDLGTRLGVPLPSRVPASNIFGRSSIAVSKGVIAVTDVAGGVEIWDAATKREQRRIAATGPYGFGATGVAFRPGTRVFALAAGDGTVTRWDADSGRELGSPIRLTARNPATGVTGAFGVFGVAFDAPGRTLAALAGDGTVAIIDAGDWKVLRRVKLQPALAFGGVAISPDGRTVAAGGPNSVALANVSGTALRRLDLGRVEVRSLAFRADGRLLVAGLADGRIAFVDPERATVDGAPLVSGHGSVDAIALDPSGKYLAAGNDDGTVRLWDLATRSAIGPPLTSQIKRVNAVAFTPHGDTLFAGSSDGTVVAYDLTLSHWVKSLCRTVGRNLTRTEWRRFLGARPYRATCAERPSGN